MAICKDCIHYSVCGYAETQVLECSHFKNKADVVEVVRCKDCRYYKEDTVGGIENLMLCQRLSPTKTFCMSNDFCNYGIRKEVEQ